ncbi:MAG: glutamate racemase [Nitrospirota bacterium]|nr:MAG: glutamate racemase [Nitrospirota bacterium]
MGGLTVFRELISRLPGEDIIYLGDTARVPYGTRTPETVIRYSFQNSSFLVKKGIKALVVACNTASAVAIDDLKSRLSVPVIGVIEPGARAAARMSAGGKVGIIGTEATINSGSYQRTMREIMPDADIVSKPCPLFVPLVEEGWTSGKITLSVIREYLNTMKRRKVDTLVLGCTHYPLLKEAISEYMGDDTVLIDSAVEVAKEVRKQLRASGLLREGKKKGKYAFFVTDSVDKFRVIGGMFLGRPISNIEHVDIA